MVMSGASNVRVEMPLTVYPAPQQAVALQPPSAWGINMNHVQVAEMVAVQPSVQPMPVGPVNVHNPYGSASAAPGPPTVSNPYHADGTAKVPNPYGSASTTGTGMQSQFG